MPFDENIIEKAARGGGMTPISSGPHPSIMLGALDVTIFTANNTASHLFWSSVGKRLTAMIKSHKYPYGGGR